MTPTFPIARAFAVAVLLAMTISTASPPWLASDDKSAPQEPSFGRKLIAKGIPNFGEATPMLYRGGQPSHEGFEKLAGMGIRIVVDTNRSQRDKKQVEHLGMRYVSLPWYCPFPKDEVFARFLELIRKNPEQKIFVHCRLGNDRTGMMIAAFRMAAQGWSADQAMKEMHFFGYTAMHHLMCPGLAGYEKSFPERLKTNPAFRKLP